MKIKYLLIFALLIIQQISLAKVMPEYLLANEKNTIQVFQSISPYVVNIHKFKTVLNGDFTRKNIRSGMGSGFLWSNKGYVVTNYHVIHGAHKLAVTFKKGKTLIATLVGAEPRKDIAVLKIKDVAALKRVNGFKQFPLANSNDLLVGQKTIAIGNPYGLSRTLTTGVISALGREIPGVAGVNIPNMIQTDASINPGNSGGPLLDSQGQLIGMNTVIFSKSGASAGIGFAIPSNDIKRIVEQIIKYGKAIQAGIGVEAFTDKVAARLGIKGVIINKVKQGSPAQKAGLLGSVRVADNKVRLGDIIIAVDDKRIKDYDDLYNALESKDIGQIITIKFIRKGKIYKVKMPTVNVH